MSFGDEQRVIRGRTVLCWPHRPRVDVHVRVDLYRRDLQAQRLEQQPRR